MQDQRDLEHLTPTARNWDTSDSPSFLFQKGEDRTSEEIQDKLGLGSVPKK